MDRFTLEGKPSKFKSKPKGSYSCIIDFENYEDFEKDPISFLDNFSI